ncbi:hypothetical protein [Paractinoplanes lichenicola]|uniref:Phosphatidate cytidylyltransferase n=1 Tax=Paractinoplanes lichenicola TaxID=2802976 RepID=A0ABS1VZ14_9ACTN|nr:hypothetical protein [Actinoplanes lichenicola]MBL7259689.1 hypothetical protein [Actinoplanes lichenicola]
MRDSAVLLRVVVLAAAGLIVLVGVVGWPALLLGLAFVVWVADRRLGRKT